MTRAEMFRYPDGAGNPRLIQNGRSDVASGAHPGQGVVETKIHRGARRELMAERHCRCIFAEAVLRHDENIFAEKPRRIRTLHE